MIRLLAHVPALVSVGLVLISCGGHLPSPSRAVPIALDCTSPALAGIPSIVGPLSTAGNTYQATLTFSGGHTSKTDPIYADVKRALDSLRLKLSSGGARVDITEHTNGDDVTSISVVVRGPLGVQETEMFDRVLNTEACNARHGKGLQKQSAISRTVRRSGNWYAD